jgi:hypothetical protein
MKKRALLILAGLSLVAGCGGGGGGGSSSGSTGYTGTTTQATVTSSNAKSLSADAYTGSQVSVAASGVAKADSAGGSEPALLPPASIALKNSVAAIFAAPRSPAKTVAATAQNTINGYSGSFSYTINYDQSSGAFSGAIVFTQYKDTDTSPVMNGAIAFSGIYNQPTDSFTSLSISISSMTATAAGRSFTLNGTESFSSIGITETVNMSVVLTDNLTGRTYWVKDYVLTHTGTTLTLSGVYFDHVHGYVVISTVTPLTIATVDSIPTAGQLLFTGSNGTKARLTFTASGYTVEVDASGNDSFVLVP